MKHVYVAGPYRGKHRWIVHQNIQRAEALGFKIAQIGAIPIIPHTMFSAFDGTLTDAFWLEATLSIMRKCDAVFMLPGWRSSEGANGEFREAKILKIPVFDDLEWLQVWILTR